VLVAVEQVDTSVADSEVQAILGELVDYRGYKIARRAPASGRPGLRDFNLRPEVLTALRDRLAPAVQPLLPPPPPAAAAPPAPSTPGISLPGLPGVSIPGITIPGINTPIGTTPGISIPGVTIPGLPGMPGAIMPPAPPPGQPTHAASPAAAPADA